MQGAPASESEPGLAPIDGKEKMMSLQKIRKGEIERALYKLITQNQFDDGDTDAYVLPDLNDDSIQKARQLSQQGTRCLLPKRLCERLTFRVAPKRISKD